MIAVIAGTGSLPLVACRELIRRNEAFFVLVLFPDHSLADLVAVVGDRAPIRTIDIYKISSILDLLTTHGTQRVLFIGKVEKSTILKKVRFDWLGIKLLASTINKSDRHIMETLICFLREHHIDVINQQDILGALHVAPGVLAGTLTEALRATIDIGMATAFQIAAADIGQTVVAKDGMIVAVEALEGTSACIQRAIELTGGGVVVCKVARPYHNGQYDLPTIGAQSLIGLKKGDVAAVAWQASQTLVAHRESFIERAQELEITLVALDT